MESSQFHPTDSFLESDPGIVPTTFIYQQNLFTVAPTPTMSSRLELIARGKTSPAKKFSMIKPFDTITTLKVAGTLSKTIPPSRRDQILNDPTTCAQWMVLWDDKATILTRPEFASTRDGDHVVIGSSSSRIGVCSPVSLPSDVFRGTFTTLVPLSVAQEYNLPTYQVAPEDIKGAPLPATVEDRNPQPASPSLSRLNFQTFWPDVVEENDPPRIVTLPVALPLPPGLDYPASWDITRPFTFPQYPLLEHWRKGIIYKDTQNGGYGVLSGGPLFTLDDLAPHELCMTDPRLLHAQGWADPTPINPHTPAYAMVTQTIREWSDNCWLGLGLDLTPSLDSTPASSPEGSTPASTSTPATSTDFHSFLQAFIATKSKKETYQAKTALSVATGYSLLLARLPRESEDPQQLVLAELSPAFISILENPKPQDAAIEFRQLLRGSLEQANASDLAIERDTTLVADVATLNLVNCLRSGYWLHKPVAAVDKHTLETMIGLIHTLTPDRIALQAITSRESSNGPIVLSHVADDRAQLDASRQSKLYTGGLRTTGRDIYHAICNLRKLLGVISPVADDSLVVRKLLRYANVLNSAQGKDWLHLHSNHPYLPYYLLQEAQHILTLYCNTAMSPALRTAALEKRPILPYNFAVASSAADTIVEKLASAMMSSDLGAFSYRPILHSILHPTGKQPQDSVPPSPPIVRPRAC